MNKRVDTEVLSSANADLQPVIEKPVEQVISAPDAQLIEPAPKGRKLAKGKRKGEQEDADQADAEGEQAEGGAAGGAGDVSADNTGELLAQNQAKPATTGTSTQKPAASGAEGAAAEGAGETAGAGMGEMGAAGAAAAGAAALGLAAAGGGGGAAVAAGAIVVAAAPTPFGGSVADGYISGAKIYIDANRNGIAEASEDTGILTDAQGNFSLPGGTPTAPIIAIGGTNIDTGLPNTLVLKAPAGSTIINPLTTILQEYVESTGASLAEAQADVKAALGLPSGIDLTTYDPLEQGVTDATALAAQKVAAQLAALLTLAEGDAGAAAADAIIQNIVDAIEAGGGEIDLADGATLTDLAMGAGLDPATLTAVETANGAIDSATTLAVDGPGSLSEIQEAAMNDVDDAPVFLSGMTGNVAENVEFDTLVYTAQANDLEGGTVTYSLSDNAGMFYIDSVTGEVFTDNPIDFEAASSYQITVVASDGINETSQNVTIAVGDVNEAPEFENSSSEVSVDENSADNVIFNAAGNVIDPESGNQLSFSLIGEDAGFFTLENGVVHLANPDYESTGGDGMLFVTVVASDGTNSAQHEVVVHVADENEAPVFASPASVEINENNAPYATVFMADANDPENQALTYSITSDPSGKFGINAFSGAVTVSETLDYETNGSYEIQISATDGGVNVVNQTVTINVNDRSDANPVFDTPPVSMTIAETAGSVLVSDIDVSDGDGDTITFSLSGENASSFSIDANGVLTVNNPNFEGGSNPLLVTVNADDGAGGVVASQNYTVHLTNVDEAPEIFGVGSTYEIPEGVASAGGYFFQANASDPEGGSVTYSLLDDGDGDFAIDPFSGVVSFTQPLDFETQPNYTIVVEAHDGAGHSSTQSVLVNVLDSPDFTGELPSTVSFFEGNEAGEELFQFTADGVGTTFDLLGGDGDFTIDPSTGVLTVNTEYDYENDSEFTNVIVVAVGPDGIPTFHDLTIQLKDVDEAPEFNDGSGITVSIDENNSPFQWLTNVGASDPEGGPVTYSMGAFYTYDGKFSFDGEGGISVQQSLDYEGQSSYSIFVTAGDAAGNTSHFTVTVNVNDINEEPTFNLSDNADEFGTYHVTDSISAATVLTVYGEDPESADLTYSLSSWFGEHEAFSLVAGGEGSMNVVLDNPDFEARSSYYLTVGVSDGNETTYQTVTVQVDNVFENYSYPEFTSPASATMFEGESGLTVLEVAAFDSDNQGDLTYSLNPTVGDACDFSINPSTGALVFNGMPDYLQQREYHIEIAVNDSADGTSHWAYQDFTMHVAPVEEQMAMPGLWNVNTGGVPSDFMDMRLAPDADYIGVAEGSSIADASSFHITTIAGYEAGLDFMAYIDGDGFIGVDGNGDAYFDSFLGDQEAILNRIMAMADQMLDVGEIAALASGDTGDSFIITDTSASEDGAVDVVAIFDTDINALQLTGTELRVASEADLIATMPSVADLAENNHGIDFYDLRLAEGADYIGIQEGWTVAADGSFYITGFGDDPFYAYINDGMIDVDEVGNIYFDEVRDGFGAEAELDAIITLADQLLGENQIAAFNFDEGSAYVVMDTDGDSEGSMLAAVLVSIGTDLTAIQVAYDDPTRLWLQDQFLV
jgi:hypothetical protein